MASYQEPHGYHKHKVYLHGVVELSRSQTKILGDALDLLRTERKSRTDMAEFLEIPESVIQKCMSRKACVRLGLEHLEALSRKLGIDISGWDLSQSSEGF